MLQLGEANGGWFGNADHAVENMNADRGLAGPSVI
jgi:hypothetical protein